MATMDEKGPNVGPRVRAIREAQKLSLRALSERCNLSVNAISLIERGETSPTVSSLHMLSTALGTGIADFFSDERDKSVVFVRRRERVASQGSGMVMESLGTGLVDQRLGPFLVTLEPGAVHDNAAIVHPGQEFVYCLQGEIVYQVNRDDYHLLPGDSILFEAGQPHRFRNAGDMPAQMLIVFQTEEGGHLARDRHFG